MALSRAFRSKTRSRLRRAVPNTGSVAVASSLVLSKYLKPGLGPEVGDIRSLRFSGGPEWPEETASTGHLTGMDGDDGMPMDWNDLDLSVDEIKRNGRDSRS